MKLSMRSINVNHQIEGLKKTTQPDHRQKMKSKRWSESRKRPLSFKHQEDTIPRFSLEPFNLAT